MIRTGPFEQAPWCKNAAGVRIKRLAPGLELRVMQAKGKRGRWVIMVFGHGTDGTAATRAEAKAAAESFAHARLLDALRALRGSW